MEKYKVTIGEQLTQEKTLKEAVAYLEKLADLGFIKLGLKLVREKDQSETKEEIAPIDSKKGIEQRDQAREKMLKKAEKEERLKNSVQKIKPVYIDPKIVKMAREGVPNRRSRIKFPVEMEGFVKDNLDLKNREIADKVNEKFGLDMDQKKISDYMRQRNIKRKAKEKYKQTKKFRPEVDKYIKDHAADMSDFDIAYNLKIEFGVDTTAGSISNRKSVIKAARFKSKKKEQPEEKIDRRKISKYPDEMKGFIKEHMETNSNQQLCDLINEKWNINIDKIKLNSYRTYNKLKRVNIIRSPRKKGGKRASKPKKYTDEVLQFLKDNINNFKNRDLCEELESRFNIKTTQASLQNTLSRLGIKRDIPPEVEPEIEDFILQSKIKDAYILKDKIIEKFDKNIETRKIINIMNKRIEDLPGESVKEEVDRIEEQRIKKQKDPFDEEVDELELD